MEGFVLLVVFVLILLKQFIVRNELEILVKKVFWYKDAVILKIYLENHRNVLFWLMHTLMRKPDSSEYFLVV